MVQTKHFILLLILIICLTNCKDFKSSSKVKCAHDINFFSSWKESNLNIVDVKIDSSNQHNLELTVNSFNEEDFSLMKQSFVNQDGQTLINNSTKIVLGSFDGEEHYDKLFFFSKIKGEYHYLSYYKTAFESTISKLKIAKKQTSIKLDSVMTLMLNAKAYNVDGNPILLISEFDKDCRFKTEIYSEYSSNYAYDLSRLMGN